MIFDEVVEDYCELPHILTKLDEWKKKDMNAYKEAYVHLCLPKIVSVFVRAQMILWTPFQPEFYEDIDKMKWFDPVAMYGKTSEEIEETLRKDPDVFLIPSIIEKVVVSKLSSKSCEVALTKYLNLIRILKQGLLTNVGIHCQPHKRSSW